MSTTSTRKTLTPCFALPRIDRVPKVLSTVFASMEVSISLGERTSFAPLLIHILHRWDRLIEECFWWAGALCHFMLQYEQHVWRGPASKCVIPGFLPKSRAALLGTVHHAAHQAPVHRYCTLNSCRLVHSTHLPGDLDQGWWLGLHIGDHRVDCWCWTWKDGSQGQRQLHAFAIFSIKAHTTTARSNRRPYNCSVHYVRTPIHENRAKGNTVGTYELCSHDQNGTWASPTPFLHLVLILQ